MYIIRVCIYMQIILNFTLYKYESQCVKCTKNKYQYESLKSKHTTKKAVIVGKVMTYLQSIKINKCRNEKQKQKKHFRKWYLIT